MKEPAAVTAIVLGTNDLDISRTIESLRDEIALSEAEVIVGSPDDTAPWSSALDGVVLLLRAGDRMRAGGAAAMMNALVEADVVLGGYQITGSGHWGLDVLPPNIDDISGLAKWAIASPFELSAIGLRRSALPSAVRPAPCLPGGELALVHATLEVTPMATIASIRDIVAEVRMRPVHKGDTAATLAQLRGVLEGPFGRDPTIASRIRRRALSLTYLESKPSVAGQFDADSWWGPALAGSDDGAALSIFRDLHWVLSCLFEARRLAELGFDGLAKTALSDVVADLPPDTAGVDATNESLHLLVAELTTTIVWLHEEVRKRDDQLAKAEWLHHHIAELSSTISWLHEEVRIRDEQIAERRSAE